ncbi:MAG TPA: hypothetical protein PKO06_02670 [Candidatus Ozemobacteraceae bacterium]|nr:hypothetical protein [Candidatus Ozemobacteraceae bacterium]
MALTTQIFTFPAGGLWWVFGFITFVATAEPLQIYRKHRDQPAVRKRCLIRLALRLLLVVLLIPPFTWAVTEGRWGAIIRLRDRELIGTTYFGRFLGKIDLDGVSLRLEHRAHSRGSTWTLVGAKKFEHLRIDGFVDRSGRSLVDVVRVDFHVPTVEMR